MLNNCCNIVFGRFFLPFLKTLLISGFILSFFAVVRLYKDLDIFSLVLVAVLAASIPLVIVPISVVMSSFYDTSSKFNRQLCLRIHLIANKKHKAVFDRELKSCPLIRCQVGNVYHMEAKAKLTLIHHVLNAIAFLMVNVK